MYTMNKYNVGYTIIVDIYFPFPSNNIMKTNKFHKTFFLGSQGVTDILSL